MEKEQPVTPQSSGSPETSGKDVSATEPTTRLETTAHSGGPVVSVAVPDRKETEVSSAVKLLVERMHMHVAEHQPYRNPEFNIASLSESMGVPQHHIAFIFRQVLHQSFVEYRNSLRVEHAKGSIRAGRHKQITIEAIGTDAGFSSRATFFAVFKEITGMTPGQYAEECGSDSSS